MNLLLLEQTELLAEDFAVIEVARYPPRPGLWPPQIGRKLRVGICNGKIGEAVVEQVSDGSVFLRFRLDQHPPLALPLTLVLALPRPKMLRRVLRSATELGIKKIYLVNATRVEKSYWQSPLLRPERLRGYLLAGLEQACDTLLPEVHLRNRLRPFVEDELDSIAGTSARLLAHPGATQALRSARGHATILAVGPEGGFSDFELELFGSAGFAAFTLGPRVLRVETALPALSATLFGAQ